MKIHLATKSAVIWKCKRNFLGKYKNFFFSGLTGSFLKYKKFFKLYNFMKYKTFVLEWAFFHFSSSESPFLKYKKTMRLESSIFGNIRNSLILELESSISWNIGNFFRVDVFYFFKLGLKSAPGDSIIHYYGKQ